ncbi:MAG: hypothetical protein IPH45_16265 [Bacteroidales bacterium]|nr:hypothetical protein [Bacteroidales bacterium]
MKWINATGMLLQFLAFWFAAPELLGDTKLKAFEKGLKNLIAAIPMILLILIITIFSVSSAVSGILKGMNASREGVNSSELYSYYLILLFALILYFIFVFFYKRIHIWLVEHLAKPLSYKLINQQSTRKSALIVGAILFTIGFLCQFILVFV